MSQEPPRPSGLSVGSKAPMIDTQDIYGNSVNLNTLLEEYDGVLIDFFRGNWWGHWKKHLNLLTNEHQRFIDKDIKLISIASDSIRLLRKFKEENEFSIDIISDKGARIAKNYDVYWFAPGGGGSLNVKQAVPSKFLINKAGIIVWTYIGKDKTDRPSIELMMEAIDTKLWIPVEWDGYIKVRCPLTTRNG